ncbi:MAG: tRNA 2-thiouridine(34) synthase MnmA [Leptospirales bacterium]|nr:tRNA 2-thiouridine(34) synthase MnmA [Leptospirales bacterium]
MSVAVLASGGVDSSLALQLLREEGRSVTAYYLKIWLEDELDDLGQCPWEEDLEFVERLCEQCGADLEIAPLQREYRERIIEYALSEIRNGRTPNPDILCNSRIKFGAFFDFISDRYDSVATGHYAGLRSSGERRLLITAPDPVKDQTYFLAHLSQAQLSRALFPIGRFRKGEVRELARKYKLPAQDRKDSQGLCFLGKIDFREFIRRQLGERAGELIELESGRSLGEHRGHWFYTIGQRQGLRLSGGPWYVASKDIERNRVLVSRRYYEADKPRDRFRAAAPHWINAAPPDGQRLRIKLRHGEGSHYGRIDSLHDGSLLVQLEERDQGIAPGQFAVFYDSDVCLGCAVILEESLHGEAS